MRYAVSYDSVQEFILDNALTENDTILLHPSDYDNVAKEFVAENNLLIFRPVEVLGVKVLEDNADEVRRNNIMVMTTLAAS